MSGFESTSLWKSTLGTGDEAEYLRSTFLQARETTSLLLSELGESVPAYTVHDVTHADALWETADKLIGDGIAVNPVEGFVLGMAFLLHDAAMGSAAYQNGPAEVLGEDSWRDLVCSVFRDREGRWPTDEELAAPPAPVVAEATSTAIRESHARQAAVLVTRSWTGSGGTPYFLLDDARLRDWYGPVLAHLVESHWWSVERVSTTFRRELGAPPWLQPDWVLDPLKLACLLRLADATQIDARRAPTLLLLIRRPAGESARHWRFQQYVNRPQLRGDRMTYTSARAFTPAEGPAWWLALDYLGRVDQELREVDDLMHDRGRPRFAARGVAGVGTPARFAELFPVEGWRPVDADVKISDIHGLVAALGGEQLYGDEPQVAARELIQNAHDAVMARRALEPSFEGSIMVALAQDADRWTLTVQDDGIGMDEDVLIHGLMDFGSSGWRTRLVRQKFSGLMSSGFRPRGRFGIGFFSVFMLGDGVEVVSRRYDQGRADARQLLFTGLADRPRVTSVDELVPVGTSVSIQLRRDPYGEDGLLWEAEELGRLVRSLALETDVRVLVLDEEEEATDLAPVPLSTATPAQVFDRLYGLPDHLPDDIGTRLHRRTRDQFIRTAGEFVDGAGRRLGLAAHQDNILMRTYPDHAGFTMINGFTADRESFFVGYVTAEPGRASRDNADVAVDDASVGRWLESQERALRAAGRLTVARQLEWAGRLLDAGLPLAPDYHVALTQGGPLTLPAVREWAAAREEIVVPSQGTLSWRADRTGGVFLVDSASDEGAEIGRNWIVPSNYVMEYPFHRVLKDRRDGRFSSAEDDEDSWRRRWFNMSAAVQGLVVAGIAGAWSCDIEDLLRPCEEREWSDTATFSLVSGPEEIADVLLLIRPAG